MDPHTPPAPSENAILVMDSGAIDRALKRIAHEIIERNPDLAKVALIGIPSRGMEIAKRLGQYIGQFGNAQIETGTIDVAMHRDDLHTRRRMWPVQPTQLPHELTGRTIILADDVLFSGRTIRAAMDAISSFGRPARIQLAVLVDRGHRELPIRADYVGKNLPTSHDQRVFVRFRDVDGTDDAVWIEKL